MQPPKQLAAFESLKKLCAAHSEGKSWTAPYLNPDLPDPIVQGSMIAGDHTPPSLGVGEPLFFTNAHTELDRANDTYVRQPPGRSFAERLTGSFAHRLMMSTSGGLHWEEVFQIQHGCSEYTGLVQFQDGRIGAGFDDGGAFPPGYQPRRNQCKGQTTNETFVLLELSKAQEEEAGQPPSGPPAGPREACALNGELRSGRCVCDAGWTGERCSTLDVRPVPSDGRYGLHDPAVPTWGGGAVWEAGRWHLIVGARAVASANDSVTDYPCDSKIVRAVSAGSDPAGPWEIVETLVRRTSWEPSLARGPKGELVMMFFGNISNPPPVGSPACAMPSLEFNLTTTNTYISVSASGAVSGPWTEPRLVRGMENRPRPGAGGYSWHCASGNPGPAWHRTCSAAP